MLPTGQHAGLKPRGSRSLSPPAPRSLQSGGGAREARPAVALRGHGSPLPSPCLGSPWRRGAAPGSSGRGWREAAAGRGAHRRSGPGSGRRGVSGAWWRGLGALRGREERRDRPGRASRCLRRPAPEAPPRQSAAVGAAPSAECAPGRLCPAWENPPAPGEGQREERCSSDFSTRGKKV